jgi:ligand-binding SRPBCC domain-containing protein
MKLFQINRQQCLPLSIEEAWTFFSDPRNLQKITPPSLRFEVLSDLPERIYPGELITYRIRPFLGIPLKWITEITHVFEPRLFIDEQRFGPYRFWQHQHHFRRIAGGVEVRDLVHYSLYGGPLASLIDTAVVRKQLTTIFDYRREYLEKTFGSL